MPVLFVAIAILILIFLIRVIVGFISAPVATMARLLGWSLNLVGLIALFATGVLIVDGLGGGFELLPIVGFALLAIAAFTASSLLARARRRAELRRLAADQIAVERQLERRNRV